MKNNIYSKKEKFKSQPGDDEVENEENEENEGEVSQGGEAN